MFPKLISTLFVTRVGDVEQVAQILYLLRRQDAARKNCAHFLITLSILRKNFRLLSRCMGGVESQCVRSRTVWLS